MGLSSNDIQKLEGWISLPEAAELLELTRQGVHRMARVGELKTLRQVGNRNIYVVQTAEVEQLVRDRTAHKARAEELLAAGPVPAIVD